MNQILRRQTPRSHYGSKVPVVTVTVFKYRNKIGKIFVKAVPYSIPKSFLTDIDSSIYVIYHLIYFVFRKNRDNPVYYIIIKMCFTFIILLNKPWHTESKYSFKFFYKSKELIYSIISVQSCQFINFHDNLNFMILN